MKTKLLILVKVSVSALLLGYLLTLIDFQTLVTQLGRVSGPLLLVAFALLIAQVAISALKWKLILRADRHELSYLFLLRTYMIGNFISLFLPTSFGGDIYRVVAVKNVSQSLGKSISSVLFDRLTGLFALVSIAVFSYSVFPQNLYLWQLIALYLGAIVLFVAATSGWAVGALRRAPFAVLRKASSLIESFNLYRRNLRLLAVVLALSFLFQMNIVVINKLYCTALGVDMPFTYLLVVIPMIYLTEMLPISINGLGVRESAFVFFFAALGQSREAGFAVALLVVMMRYLAGLVGGALLLTTVWKARAERHAS